MSTIPHRLTDFQEQDMLSMQIAMHIDSECILDDLSRLVELAPISHQAKQLYRLQIKAMRHIVAQHSCFLVGEQVNRDN